MKPVQRSNPHTPDQPTPKMSSEATSGSARRHARNKGLAWVSAITLGAGAASAIGTAALVATLPSTSTTTSSASAVAARTTTKAGQTSTLHSAAAPTSTTSQPVATTAAS